MAKTTVLFSIFDSKLSAFVTTELKKRGYTKITTRTSAGGYGRKEKIIAIHKNGKLRFVGEAKSSAIESDIIRYDFIVKKQTKGSGYITLHRFKFDRASRADRVGKRFFDDYDKLVGRLEETGFPDAFEFLSETHVSRTMRGKTFITATNQIKSTMVISLVTIDEGFNTVNIAQNRIQEPNIKCWFLMECIGYQQATFNIITDGDCFYPITRVHANNLARSMNRTIGGVQIRTKIRRTIDRKTVNVDEINTVDQELLKMAIRNWTATL